jgi:hypothetical protein
MVGAADAEFATARIRHRVDEGHWGFWRWSENSGDGLKIHSEFILKFCRALKSGSILVKSGDRKKHELFSRIKLNWIQKIGFDEKRMETSRIFSKFC